MRLLYSFLIILYSLVVRLAALSSQKARLFIDGRKNWKSKLEESVKNSDQRIWVHVSSLGEFEQALPVLEKIHQSFPEAHFIITFFSPSGFENAKLPGFINSKHYLPFDTKNNAKAFLQIAKPQLILFVKYDIWFHYLNEARIQGVPAVLFSAIMRPNQLYFQPYGKFMLSILKSFREIYVQNKLSQKLLEEIGIKSEMAGDTRFDRVASRLDNLNIHPIISGFQDSNDVIVFGSTWKDDLDVVTPFINSSSEKIIIAPHNISDSEVGQIASLIKRKTIRFSEIMNPKDINAEVLIIDNIGMLASVYSVGKLAYVGGAFHGALHNILEPAVFGIPVIFGPQHKKFPEASSMLEAGCAFEVENSDDFIKTMQELDSEKRKIAGDKSKEFVQSNLGSSRIISEGIIKYLKGANS